ncbi:MAG: hypothetical protein K6C12_08425 [Oscillospiraceae bacterium]|nr:hypothetical protein [Oscillospiraceae bacterium]
MSVLNYLYLVYTIPGYYDTDGVISWVACFFFYFGVKLVKGWQEKNRKSMTLYGLGLIVSFIALYHSWYIYYLFPGIFVGALILFTLLTWKRGKEKRPFFFAPLLLAVGIVAVLLILEKTLLSRVLGLFSLITSPVESGGSLFQNVFSSITELQKPPLWTEQISGLFRLDIFSDSNLCIINCIGGIVPFLSALAMCLIILIRIIRKDVRIEYLLLLIWYAVTLVLSFMGWRFIMLFAVPSAILAGNLAGSVSGLMDQRRFKLRPVCQGLLLVLLLLPTLCSAYRILTDFDYESDKPVGECLAKIRENTPEDTMLVSWWDCGYFLEEKGSRRTLFDGGTQHRERTFLVSRAFATEDEELSANIFRMLSGKGNKGISLMLSTFGDTEETLFLMDELLSGSKTEARELLLNKDISEELVNEITELLFPENVPPTECVITPDMPWICGWFPVYGQSMTERAEKPVRFAWEVHMMPISLSENGSTAIDTGNGYYVILEESDSSWYARSSLTEEPSEEQPMHVERVIIRDHDRYREYAQNNPLPKGEQDSDTDRASIPWTVIVTDDGQISTFSMVSSDLADSVFGRLVYLGGAGLTRYKEEPELSNEVLVYRILE